jgi:hypothetical protein
METADARRCPVCTEVFSCHAHGGACWCAGIDVPARVRAELAERHADCLCPACLTRAAADGPGTIDIVRSR